MLNRANPSGTETMCVRCGFPINSAQYHFQAIHTTDNVLATIHDGVAVTPATSRVKLNFQCRES